MHRLEPHNPPEKILSPVFPCFHSLHFRDCPGIYLRLEGYASRDLSNPIQIGSDTLKE